MAAAQQIMNNTGGLTSKPPVVAAKPPQNLNSVNALPPKPAPAKPKVGGEESIMNLVGQQEKLEPKVLQPAPQPKGTLDMNANYQDMSTEQLEKILDDYKNGKSQQPVVS